MVKATSWTPEEAVEVEKDQLLVVPTCIEFW
jgi:hypothetical protein